MTGPELYERYTHCLQANGRPLALAFDALPLDVQATWWMLASDLVDVRNPPDRRGLTGATVIGGLPAGSDARVRRVPGGTEVTVSTIPGDYVREPITDG